MLIVPALLGAVFVAGACGPGERASTVPPTFTAAFPPRDLPGTDARRGQRLLAEYGCGACHVIPGVTMARGLAGPPLTSYAYRSHVAGTMPNTPPNLVRWIRDPQAIEPRTAMPNLGVGEADARDMAAYLYTLK